MKAAVLLLTLVLVANAPVPVTAFQNDSGAAAATDEQGRAWRYRVSGDKALRPEQMSDDGEKTYLIWNADQALPAVFAINQSGNEEIVDGYMREGIFTIDRVYTRLVFRIDRKTAKADRLARYRE